MELKVGDEVFLKSGGPTMTVERIDEHGVHCMWFVDRVTMRDVFHANMLARPKR